MQKMEALVSVLPDVKQYYDPDWLLMVSRFFNICRVDTLTLAESVIGYWLKKLQDKMVTTMENSVSRTKLVSFIYTSIVRLVRIKPF